MDFIRGAELIIHNAPFDVGFIDAELKLWMRTLALLRLNARSLTACS